METAGRYEIVNTIAAGDYATVYRARDRELQREVAVKQIHQQFLADPRQLERFWREAQLLASLQHPNILTIHDIVRARGWLILELMRGSLKQAIPAGPIDLDYLRFVLLHCLNALRFLHGNGIIHGDVKPSNMLLDAQNRVKLGDFGLARRASSKDGSLLKGTTKYMAPELISDQFGPVGPASDLYSLGFSAYELMCGPQFESLFPGLGTFGRDEQIAWLMWHAAPDRALPRIGRVLEGVPDDLAQAIQTMVVKDQSRRFPSADQVIRLLRSGRAPRVASEPEAPPVEGEAVQKRRLRMVAVFAVVCSLVVSVMMLLPRRPDPVAATGPEATRGVVRNVYLGERTLVIERDDGSPREISYRSRDEVLINDKQQLFRDLQPGDRVTIEVLRDGSGRSFQRIAATRPRLDRGRIEVVEADEGRIVVDRGEAAEPLVVDVPASVPIVFNGATTVAGQPVALSQLRPDDRVEVRHVGSATGRVATELAVLRVVVDEGILRQIDLSAGELTLARGEAGDGERLVLPLADECTVTLNQRSELNARLLKPDDLRPGDKARLSHDTHVVRIDAYRVLGQAGVVQGVLEATGTLPVRLEGRDRPTPFAVGPDCTITLGGEPAGLADLRAGDVVDVRHDAPDAENPTALAIDAIRPPDPRRWAILVAAQNYDDRNLSPVDSVLADAKLLEETLVRRYALRPEQILPLLDASQVRLEQGIPSFLDRVGPGDSVLVYVGGHAYRDRDGRVYLAPKNFNLARAAASGLSLQWLVDQLEPCPAKEKLLLLDCTHAGSGPDLERQPSTAEMLATLDRRSGGAPLRTVTAIASCSAGERGHRLASEHGLFASSLAEGFSGRADANRDNRIEPTELFAFLKESMAAAGAGIGQTQTPQLFLPDATPPRLTEEAKQAIRRMIARLRQDKIDPLAVKVEAAEAESLAPGQLEPKLLAALSLLKARQRDEASLIFEQLRFEHPDLLLAGQGVVWAHFEKRTYQHGVEGLIGLVSRIPRPQTPGTPHSAEAAEVLQWSGRLREFAASAPRELYAPTEATLAKLDAAVEAHGEEAARLYEKGREHTRNVLRQFDAQIEAGNDATQARLRVERRQVRNYAEFPYDRAAAQILAGLDR